MSRSERLLALLQVLRRHRRPVSGRTLAEELGVSLRTLYRDIASLQAQGAAIEGEAGLGYVLRPGFTLPPLMFSPEEIEALVLGARWVSERADDELAQAADDALAKIAAVLPGGLRDRIETSPLLVGPAEAHQAAAEERLAVVRQAIHDQSKLRIAYRDAEGMPSERTVWPFALGFFDRARVLIAWCELRQAFRHFRLDRIAGLEIGGRYPRSRLALLSDWRAQERVAPPP